MTPGSVIVASVGSGPRLPHTDVATHPEVLPPNSRDISGCHLSSFLCLSEDYHVAVQAGTALGEAGEAHWGGVKLLEKPPPPLPCPTSAPPCSSNAGGGHSPSRAPRTTQR